jgi:hypothetical protein
MYDLINPFSTFLIQLHIHIRTQHSFVSPNRVKYLHYLFFLNSMRKIKKKKSKLYIWTLTLSHNHSGDGKRRSGRSEIAHRLSHSLRNRPKQADMLRDKPSIGHVRGTWGGTSGGGIAEDFCPSDGAGMEDQALLSKARRLRSIARARMDTSALRSHDAPASVYQEPLCPRLAILYWR